jgi:lipooligosaccharide transport system permease protein
VELPGWLRPWAELMPLTHPVRLSRALCLARYDPYLPWDLLYILVFTALTGYLGIRRLRNRLVK